MNTSTCKDKGQKTLGEQAFIITLAEAKEVKFYFDVMKKTLGKHPEENREIRFCLRQITVILNQAKKERPTTTQKE